MEKITIIAIVFLAILAGPARASRINIVEEIKVIDKDALAGINEDMVLAAVEQLNGPCAPVGTSCQDRSCCSSADYNVVCTSDEICKAKPWPSPDWPYARND